MRTLQSAVLTVALGCASATPAPAPPAESTVPVTRIGVGSCAHQDRPQPIWDTILASKPDTFLFIGDNVYADTRDEAEMRAAYAKLGAEPHYKRFAAKVPIDPIWDDHDYGENDAGADYPMKLAAEQIFLDFFAVPKDDDRRKRPGIYYARTIGEPGRRVQLIMLDTRYFKSPWAPREGGEHPFHGRWQPTDDPKKTILGDEQWAWLEAQLRQPADVRLIASGIQFLSEQHGWEKWANFPRERQRLFDLIRSTKASGVILLSGDRHKGELSMMDAGVGYPLYDLTSSGLNQGFDRWFHFEMNRHRINAMRWGNVFGLVEIHWTEDPEIRLEIRYENGDVAFSHRIRKSTLQVGSMPEIPPDH